MYPYSSLNLCGQTFSLYIWTEKKESGFILPVLQNPRISWSVTNLCETIVTERFSGKGGCGVRGCCTHIEIFRRRAVTADSPVTCTEYM